MSTVAATRQLVVCALGAEEYGLPIEQVREIVRYETPRPVASDLPSMRGVIGLRGRLIPVHDLASWLGVTSTAGDPLAVAGGRNAGPAGARLRSPEGETGTPSGDPLAVAGGRNPISPAAKLVIVEAAAEPIGLLVDDVVEVLTVEESQIEPVPSGSGEIVRIGDRLVLLLDAGELGA
jgi:purine-binding chemotaxis protein CheW